jgi:aspartate racemase
MKKPLIGILAGMGPRSTAPFVDKVVEECALQYGAKYDIDFPAMLVYSLPTPFYPDRPVNHSEMKRAILSGLMELAGFGADFIAMPCNLAHIYYEDLDRCVPVPLLNIVDETVKSIPPDCLKIALFATRATMESGIYQNGIECAGKAWSCTPEQQDAVGALIATIKAEGVNEHAKSAMSCLFAQAKQSRADYAVVACTDLTPAAQAIDPGMEAVDSATCLAKATVELYIEKKWKNRRC